MKKLALFIFVYSFFSFSVFSQSQYKLSCDSAQGQEFKKADTYVRASVDESGHLRIFTSDAREIVLQKDSGQVGFDKVVISEDGHSVGWVALYPNSSTSYPIPLKLMIYSSGDLSTLTGIGEPVWRWHFTARGKQVAFEQETTHGSQGIHYELREVATGRLIAEYEPEYGPDNLPIDIQNVPKWVEELNVKQ
ncbi:MAG: hypothetical protein ABSA44_08220 [Bacteroidota bacterium]|jgi:hypothetical protein